MTTASLPRVPEGLRDLMKVYTKEVLREKPADLYGFSASFFNMIVGEKSHQSVRKYEPVQTYETIMKNRIRQQVPLSMVFNLIPEKLTDLIKQFIKAVLREKPDNIYIFAQEYFQRMSKEKSDRIEYSKYSSYEKSLKDKENVTSASKVTCECGRVLSANKKDVVNTASVYTDNKLAEADQRAFSSRITYIQSVVIIQRHFRRYLSERKVGRTKDKCNNLEYVAAILLIQRQVRRYLATKRVEKLKNSRDAQKHDGKPKHKAADYMKAVVVIQRHYRIYLKKKQEQNRLKHGPVSLATAAIIIQRAYRRMVTRHRAKRTTSSGTDHAEELNDNASETGSYTSVSTALLSTESTELGMANFEERVHQKIIHEDEEVENSNVDASLEKEYFAEDIKGERKSINLRKSEILSGALIESMICKPDLQKNKNSNESKEFDVELNVNLHQPAKLEQDITDEKITIQDPEPEVKVENTTSLDLETMPQIEVKAQNTSKDFQSVREDHLKSKKSSLDIEPETPVECKDKPATGDLDSKTEDEIKANPIDSDSDQVEESKLIGKIVQSEMKAVDSGSDLPEESRESEDSTLPSNIGKKESDDVQENNAEQGIASSDKTKNGEKDTAIIASNEIVPPPKILNSENQLQEVQIKNEITPTVSIEIEHVEDISLEDSLASPDDLKAKDLSEGTSVGEETKSIPNVEVDSLKSILVNHNLEVREQDDKNVEASAETQNVISNEEIHPSDTHENIRERTSIEDEDTVQSNLESQDVLITESKVDQDEIQINNDHKLELGGKSEIIAPKVEEVPKTAPKDTKDGEVSGSTEKVEIHKEEPLEEIMEAPNHDITLDKVIETDPNMDYHKVSENNQERMRHLPSEDVETSTPSLAETSHLPGTPSGSLIQEAIGNAGDTSEDTSTTQPKSEWFVGSTRIIPSQGVVEGAVELETNPDTAAIATTSKAELTTSTQVETVETVDRTHGSLESKLNPGTIIDENLGDASEKDNAISSGLAGLAEASEDRLDSVEDALLLSQSEFGGLVQSLDIASTQELLNAFLQNEIEYSSKHGPFPSAKLLEEVIEEPCIKRCASLVTVSEGESEPDIASQKVENTDSSLSETTGLDTLSADTIDKATVKLSKPEEVIEKMSQLRDSKSLERISSADPSFDEPVIRPMSSLQEQSSLDIEDGDIIVYNRLQRDETRESSAQSDSVVFGDEVSENNQEKELLNEEESGRVHLMRHYTIAGDDPRGLFRSVTIDDALSYVENGAKGMGASSFCLDDETSENIRKKMMAYSLSETDSDYFDPKKVSNEDMDIDTAMADAMGTSTETESTIVSAATKIQAGARGFLTRRRLRRASAGTKSSTLDTKASFGNDAISESLERFIEEEAAKKIQAAYRMHTRKRKVHSRKMEGISLESNLAARRQKLQRGDALRNDSTPDDENSLMVSAGKGQKSAKTQRSKTVGEARSSADMELRWLKMRQNSMPVQIDCEVFRVIPKHMRKRIKSAEANKRK
uniref:GG17263 n=1 Tax=Drosophila erecta TaxID=7220 RepID=B3P1J8_DROER